MSDSQSGPAPRLAWWLALLAAGLPSVLAVQTALNLYVGNAREMIGGREALLQVVLLALGAGSVLFVALHRGGRAGKFLWAVAAAYAVFFLVRDVAFPLPLGQLDGSNPFPPPSVGYTALEAATFLAAFGLLLFLPLRRTAGLAAIFTAVFAVSVGTTAPGAFGKKESHAAVKPAAPARPTATGPNVYHILLDQFQGVEMQWCREHKGIAPYDDFIYYPDTVSNYMTTQYSLPSILTGSFYDPHLTKAEWETSYLRRGLLKSLKDGGYSVRIFGYNPTWWETDLADSVRCSLDIAREHLKGRAGDEFVEVLKLRGLPALVGAWLFNRRSADGDAPLLSDDAYWCTQKYREMLRGLGQTPARGVYTFCHVVLPHQPNVMDEHGNYVGRQRGTRIGQVLFANRLIAELVAELKRLGRYDDALIVVHSDHGHCLEPDYARQALVDGRTLKEIPEDNWTVQDIRDGARWPLNRAIARTQPILLLKPPGHRGAEVSPAPAQLLDLAPTILGVLALSDPDQTYEGTDLWSAPPGPDRARKVYINGRSRGTGGFEPRFQEYLVRHGRYERGTLVPIRRPGREGE